MRFYEDFVVGAEDEQPGRYLLTEEEIREVGERWDPQPFHIDADAAEASVFGGLVASTVHLFAVFTSLSIEDDPVAAVSALGFQLKLHAPARPGDVLRVRGHVAACRLSESRPGMGIVTNVGELVNQRDELVVSVESASLIRCREATP